MAENTDSDAFSFCEDVPYHSTPMEIDDTSLIPANLPVATLLKKLGPQYENRLFSQIVKTKDISHVTNTLIGHYIINKDEFINCVVQLFVDISAYQYINVENYVKHNNLKNIVSYMEKSNNSILYTTGQYIVKMRKYKLKCTKIGDFLEMFILVSSKEKILYDTPIKVIFHIVEQMSQSKLRPIKHTGVFIALKLKTGLFQTSHMIMQKIETYQYASEHAQCPKDKRIFEHKVEKYHLNSVSVNGLIEFMYLNIFMKNWNHGDPKLHFMRNDCLLEVGKWIKIFPDRFLDNDYVLVLIKSIKDNHHMVRLTALNILGNIIKDYYLKISEQKMNLIISKVTKRMNDINYGVAIKAVETLTMIHKFTKLPHAVRDEICKLIFYPHYPLAKAAGKFLLNRMERYITDPNHNEEYIKMLIFFEKKSTQQGYINMYPLLIETLIDSVPVLRDVSAYLLILENCKHDDESISILINILTESVYQTFLGSCSLVRPKQIKRKVDPEQVQKMTKQLVAAIEKLTSLVSPLKKLTTLLVLIRDYGMKKYDAVDASDERSKKSSTKK